jgi:hypothetical protein
MTVTASPMPVIRSWGGAEARAYEGGLARPMSEPSIVHLDSKRFKVYE